MPDGTDHAPVAGRRGDIYTRPAVTTKTPSSETLLASPWACLREHLERGPSVPAFLWEAPSGESIAGIGIAAQIVASGAGRFSEARDRIAAVLAEGFPGAIAIGGLGFSDAPSCGSGWPGFPGAWLAVPKRAWWSAPGGTMIEATWGDEAGAEPRGLGPARDNSRSERRLEGDAGARTRESWSDAVRESLRGIASGQMSKVVLARCLDVTLSPRIRAPDILDALRASHPSCYRFMVADGRGRAFLGASPERLIRLVGGEVRTEAVAGTVRRAQSRGDLADEDRERARALLESPKERSEHELVLRHIRDRLGAACGELDYPAEPQILALRHMLHLRTPVRGRARDGAHVLDLAARLHPTPAVAGWPRDAALSAIGELEPMERGWYAGGVGWVNAAGEGDFAVGIRSVSLVGDRARLFAGAGIVAGSDPDLEWSETELKMRPILDAIASA